MLLFNDIQAASAIIARKNVHREPAYPVDP